jgi:tRNA(Ile)-lysidine synthase
MAEARGGHDLTGRMRGYIEDNGLIRQGDHVIVAISGGADSVCLLYCLNELKDCMGFKVSALHVEHGIRGEESVEDARFTESLCRGLGVDFVMRRIPAGELKNARGLSLEEAARLRRYEFLEEGRLRAEDKTDEGGRGLIAVAHHRDDQAETVLLNIFRGAGIEGVRGMLPARGMVIRPLLFARRAEIEAFLIEKGMAWRTDSTNLEDGQTRNRIRNHFLPYIENEVNPQAVEHIAALAEDAGEIASYLEDAAEKWLRKAVAEAAGINEDSGLPACGTEECLELAISMIDGTPPLVVRMGLRRAIERLVHLRKDIGRVHLAALAQLAGKKVGSQLDLPYGLRAERGYKTIKLALKKSGDLRRRSPEAGATKAADAQGALETTDAQNATDAKKTPYAPYTVEGTFGRIRLRVFDNKKDIGTLIPKKKYTKWFDYDKMKNRPKLRSRRIGDRISMKGVGTKTVKSLMIDLHIPAKARGHVPILADDEAVIWVVGYRINDDYLVTENTKQILEAVYEPGEA